jgi:hypothetical protein
VSILGRINEIVARRGVRSATAAPVFGIKDTRVHAGLTKFGISLEDSEPRQTPRYRIATTHQTFNQFRIQFRHYRQVREFTEMLIKAPFKKKVVEF